MIRSRAPAMVAIAVTSLILWACVEAAPPPPPPPAPPPPTPHIAGPQSISERTLLTMATDLAFPSGGYTLTRAGKAKLDQVIPDLSALQGGSKVVVYGYTDDRPVGARLKRRGIVDNLDLSSKRANEVVRYLASQGINPSIMSAKGRGDTHSVAPNDTPQGRAQNRRIEVVVEQPTG